MGWLCCEGICAKYSVLVPCRLYKTGLMSAKGIWGYSSNQTLPQNKLQPKEHVNKSVQHSCNNTGKAFVPNNSCI